jgi:DinB superfamily
MENRAELENLQAEIRLIAEQTQNEFGTLRADQLNWKPAAASWSVAQCFDHLITSSKGYFPIVEEVVSGQKKTRFMERVPILPRIWSKLLISSLDPKATRKMKSPAAFEPSSSDLPDSIIKDFISNQSHVLDAIGSVKNLNIDRIVITSPAAGFVTYSLLGAFRIIVVHEQRHFQQAMRVKANTNFPN